MTRIARSVGLAVVAAALVAGGAGGAMLLHSPSETVLTEPPTTVLTAPVTTQVLTTNISGVGTFVSGNQLDLVVTPPAGRAAVVTAAPLAPGEIVPWCSPAIEVAGRPLLVLPGAIPAYRDLEPGDTGDDVRQLQEALSACGEDVRVDGKYGAETARAVSRIYRNAGATPVTAAADALATEVVVGDPDVATSTAANYIDEAGVTTSAATGAGAATSLAVSTTETPAPAPLTDTSTPASVPSPAAASTVVAPQGELFFVPEAVRISTIAGLGQRVGGEVALGITSGADRFRLELSAAQLAKVVPGATVDVMRDEWQTTVDVPQVTDPPTINDLGSPSYEVWLDLDVPPPPTFAGLEGTFLITVGSPDPYPLVVPATALFQDGNGITYVRRAVPGRAGPSADAMEEERIAVETLASEGGYVAIVALDGALTSGDEVVVGER